MDRKILPEKSKSNPKVKAEVEVSGGAWVVKVDVVEPPLSVDDTVVAVVVAFATVTEEEVVVVGSSKLAKEKTCDNGEERTVVGLGRGRLDVEAVDAGLGVADVAAASEGGGEVDVCQVLAKTPDWVVVGGRPLMGKMEKEEGSLCNGRGVKLW
jgi:hypothetical protein